MKVFSFILRVTLGLLVSLLALVFVVFEGALLVTFDFNLYENELLALLQTVLKLLAAISAFTLGILSIVKGKRSFLAESICLFASTAVLIPFMSNNIGLYIAAVAALFALANLFYAGVRGWK